MTGTGAYQSSPPAIPENGQGEICIQLAAPDARSNTAKKESERDEFQFESAVAERLANTHN